jgi:hypothetical protein
VGGLRPDRRVVLITLRDRKREVSIHCPLRTSHPNDSLARLTPDSEPRNAASAAPSPMPLRDASRLPDDGCLAPFTRGLEVRSAAGRRPRATADSRRVAGLACRLAVQIASWWWPFGQREDRRSGCPPPSRRPRFGPSRSAASDTQLRDQPPSPDSINLGPLADLEALVALEPLPIWKLWPPSLAARGCGSIPGALDRIAARCQPIELQWIPPISRARVPRRAPRRAAERAEKRSARNAPGLDDVKPGRRSASRAMR